MTDPATYRCPRCGNTTTVYVRLSPRPTCACPTRPGRRVTEMVLVERTGDRATDHIESLDHRRSIHAHTDEQPAVEVKR
jgi:ribosomal protein S27E